MFKFVVQLSHSLILVTESSNMALHCKELSGDLKRRIVALHEDGQGYKKIANTLKLSCSTVAKIIQRFKSAGSIQNRPLVVLHTHIKNMLIYTYTCSCSITTTQ